MLELTGGPVGGEFHDIPSYPQLSQPTQRTDATRYYGFGTLALDGHLYQFLSTFSRPFRADEAEHPQLQDVVRFNGVKMIYSNDNGKTWRNQNGSTPVIWEPWSDRSRETMLFMNEDQEAFSLLSVLQMGRNYEHNRDGYIYVYAPNGNTEGTMNELVMFRAPKSSLRDRSSYEYFAGHRGESATWTKDMNSRAVVHTFPRGWVNSLMHPYAWLPSVIYNAPIGVFIMANWGTGMTQDGLWFGKPSYLGLWTSPTPWGPWAQIHEETAWLPGGDQRARAFQPQISPKWISNDGKSLWLVWSDFQGYYDNDEYHRIRQERVKASPPSMGIRESDVVWKASMMKKYMPHYAFNTQRVDLLV